MYVYRLIGGDSSSQWPAGEGLAGSVGQPRGTVIKEGGVDRSLGNAL
jgi:hypothetical protein